VVMGIVGSKLYREGVIGEELEERIRMGGIGGGVIIRNDM
jgi:hypothetical protein